MLSNNKEKLELWKSMTNKLDYFEFKNICEVKGIQPLPLAEYAQKTGLLLCAGFLYPTLPLEEGYLKLLNDSVHQEQLNTAKVNLDNIVNSVSVSTIKASEKSNCNGCGGGKVL